MTFKLARVTQREVDEWTERNALGVRGHGACLRKWTRFGVAGTQCRCEAGSEEEQGWTGGWDRVPWAP